jgi:hypothetical protein
MLEHWQMGLLSRLVVEALKACPTHQMSDEFIREFVKAEVATTENREWEDHLKAHWSSLLPAFETLDFEIDMLVDYYSVRLYPVLR